MAQAINYESLIVEIGKLQQQAEFLRKEELINVVNNINQQMKDYGIELNDLNLQNSNTTLASAPAEIPKLHKKVEAKFKDPVSGVTWSGRGKTPKWIVASGKAKEQFAIAS